jgi:hypothetical protein
LPAHQLRDQSWIETVDLPTYQDARLLVFTREDLSEQPQRYSAGATNE